MTYFDLKSELRDLKIKVSLSDIDLVLEPNINLIKKDYYWKYIKKYKGKAIITGSVSLKAFGLIDRDINDLDLIVLDDDIIKEKKINFLYDRFFSQKLFLTTKYGSDPIPTLIGSISVWKKIYYIIPDYTYHIDFFENENNKFIEKDGFLFNHPFEILEKKVTLAEERFKRRGNNKDYHDFYKAKDIIEKIIWTK
jgi:hypothetical protein